MVLYHGNQAYNLIPEYGKGRKNNDYGPGFYTTEDIELAREWSYNNYSPKSEKENHWLHSYDINLNSLNVFNLLDFDVLYWLSQLYHFRKMNYLSELAQERLELFQNKYFMDLSAYDVIIGWRADDSYFKYAEDFLSVDITKETLESAVKLGELGTQHFIQSKKAFESLKKIKEPEYVNEKYYKKYISRDKIARNEYELKKGNDRFSKNKTTILDVIKGEA